MLNVTNQSWVSALALAALSMGCAGDAPALAGDAPTSDAGGTSGAGAGAAASADAPDAVALDAAAPDATAADGCAAAADPGDHDLTITSGGLERSARLHVPDALEPDAAAMLVLALHGFGSNSVAMEALTGLSNVSSERGFLVVYPQGLGSAWNGGACCPGAAGDDVQFIRDLVAEVSRTHCVDPKRIFATGISNGGLMANRLACEASDLFAAVAPVASAIGVACSPERPVAHMAFSGTADPLVPIAVTEQEVATWRMLNGCVTDAEQVFAEGDATCEQWSDCDDGADVQLCRIEGGGHTWPGGVAVPILGATSTDLDASDAMVDFFDAHGR